MIAYDVKGLVKLYPGRAKPANNGVAFQIHRGEIFGILGDNGAGKSTLVRQMVNLVRPTAGSITLFDRPVGHEDPLHVPTNVGYAPQDGFALRNLTVGEALFFTAHLRGMGRAEARKERDALLELWGMGPLRRESARRLSGGQLRLLQIAAAMAGSPPVLVLDEPTSNLDPRRRRLVWDVLRRLNRERETTIVFITHDAVEAEKVVRRVGIMRSGELAALGKPSELKRLVDRKLRLEVFFSPEAPPDLPAGLARHELDAGRWLVYLDREQAASVLDRLGKEQIDDFRLYSATLEDLYLHYATERS